MTKKWLNFSPVTKMNQTGPQYLWEHHQWRLTLLAVLVQIKWSTYTRKILRLLFTQCKLSLLVICTETFSFHHTSPLFTLSLLFSMGHLLSPQAHVTSASHYDKYRAPIFFIRSYITLRVTSKKAALGEAWRKLDNKAKTATNHK
jgi:hypothetical protein